MSGLAALLPGALLAASTAAGAAAAVPHIVAAENLYGDVAAQIVGPQDRALSGLHR
jgi:hypothetical protein